MTVDASLSDLIRGAMTSKIGRGSRDLPLSSDKACPSEQSGDRESFNFIARGCHAVAHSKWKIFPF